MRLFSRLSVSVSVYMCFCVSYNCINLNLLKRGHSLTLNIKFTLTIMFDMFTTLKLNVANSVFRSLEFYLFIN